MKFLTLRSSVKPCLLKYLKWLLKVVKGQRAGKGHILFLDQTNHKWHIRSSKGKVPFSGGLERTLVRTWVLCWDC